LLLADGASVILTSSTTSIKGTPAFNVYSATKAAVRNFARSWILDLKDRRLPPRACVSLTTFVALRLRVRNSRGPSTGGLDSPPGGDCTTLA
jgi:hypothetical protein